MSFAEQFRRMDWADIEASIQAKTAADVERALSRPQAGLEDFKALVSPAAEPYLEAMAQRSMALTQQRFGKTIQFYLPLYLSNVCSNVCTYCGFSITNKILRHTLSMEELDAEIAAIKAQGFDHILLVTGEAPHKVGMAYFHEAFERLKPHFSHIAIEVQPLEQAEYEALIDAGLDAVLVYQETYHQPTYAEVHTRGKKADFFYRLDTADRLGRAGIDKVGLGALIGLAEDWRTDCYFVAAHLDYLERHYWQTRYSISFPRLRPCAGGFPPKAITSEKQLLQLICAYRIFNHTVELSLSTRESQRFRDNVIPLGITTMSAGSSTQPGGYAEQQQRELEQFSINDERIPLAVADVVQAKGYEPVWKDWDRSLTKARPGRD